jgi:hypothetical protein
MIADNMAGAHEAAVVENYEWPKVETVSPPTGLGAGRSAEDLSGILDRVSLKGDLASKGPYQAALADVRGRVVSSVAGTGSRWTLSTVGLPAGLYFLELR